MHRREVMGRLMKRILCEGRNSSPVPWIAVTLVKDSFNEIDFASVEKKNESDRKRCDPIGRHSSHCHNHSSLRKTNQRISSFLSPGEGFQRC